MDSGEERDTIGLGMSEVEVSNNGRMIPQTQTQTRAAGRESKLRPINTRHGLALSVSGGSSLGATTTTRSTPTSPLARSFVSSDTSSAMPLLQSLKETSTEGFKQARACGMLPMQPPVYPPQSPAGFPPLPPTSPEYEREINFVSYEDAINLARAYVNKRMEEKARNGGKGEGLASTSRLSYRQRTPSPSGSRSPSVPPSPRFSPVQTSHMRSPHSHLQDTSPSPSPSSSSTLKDGARRTPPAFVPDKNAPLLLMHLDSMIKCWEGMRTGNGGHQLYLHHLIAIQRLLQDHRGDAQVEEIRSRWERDNDMDREGTSSAEGEARPPTDKKWRKDLDLIDLMETSFRVFGHPLYLTQLYASCVACMGGFQHDLPIVVYACVEELYRTGMTTPGLFRSPPDSIRHKELIDSFDHAPDFGRRLSLVKESTSDICALLRSYIDRVPEPLWHESLFDAFWTLCVEPSIAREKHVVEEMKRKESSDGSVGIGRTSSLNGRPTSLIQTQRRTYGANGFEASNSFSPALRRRRSASLDSPRDASFFRTLGGTLDIAAAMHVSDEDLASEKPHQLAAARMLFRLLPRPQMSVLAYLCAFFSQVPLCVHENGMGMEDIARLFGAPIFLGASLRNRQQGESEEGWMKRKEQAKTMMAWLLRRWNLISEGLFDPLEPLPCQNAIEAGDGGELAESATMSTLSDSESLLSLSITSHSTWPESLGTFDDARTHARRSSLGTDDGGYSDQAIRNDHPHHPELRQDSQDDAGHFDDIMRWKFRVQVERENGDLSREVDELKARLGESSLGP
ncbi:Rho GTPase activation protein [Schizopora paradoxa]|uniref:Rho GTPase activation protein n=1 Tax=Schizopora paradoxa TaxID=27342 RepID=A0A0H2RI83_9AGAM|nr:Rho GTPase activation protein [Schizopora paradoxa]